MHASASDDAALECCEVEEGPVAIRLYAIIKLELSSWHQAWRGWGIISGKETSTWFNSYEYWSHMSVRNGTTLVHYCTQLCKSYWDYFCTCQLTIFGLLQTLTPYDFCYVSGIVESMIHMYGTMYVGVIPHSNKTTEYRKTVGCHTQNRVNPWNLIRNWGITNSRALWKYVKTEYPLSLLAVTKQLYEWSFPSVCLSVCHTFLAAFLLCSHHRIIMKYSGVITNDRSDVHAKGQGQRSKVKVTEVNTLLNPFRTVTPVWIDIGWWNYAYSLMLLRRGALLFLKVIRQISRSHGSKKRRIWPRLGVSGL